MEQRYYFTIEFLPEHADAKLLAGCCISILHGFFKTNGTVDNVIGVSFPFWSDNSIGKGIAFVSIDKNFLCGLSYQPYFALMKKENIFNISQIITVPNDIPDCRYVRNSTIDKAFLSSKNKRQRRIEKRAENANRAYSPISREERVFDSFHSIFMESKSTEYNFALQIQKKSLDIVRIDNQFNSYGFATNKKWLGSVPDLTLLF